MKTNFLPIKILKPEVGSQRPEREFNNEKTLHVS
jgi:hypothetical protein